MAVITISRQFGAGGETLGRMIADELDYTFVDSNILQMIAKEANVSPNFVKLVEEESGTKLAKVISKMVSKRWLDCILAGECGYIDEKIYIDYLVLIVAQIADEGNAVIMGRGSQYILSDHPDAYHILLINEFENRVKFLMEHHNLSNKRAIKAVNTEDKRRANLYSKLGKKDYDDPSNYHLVLNMDCVSLESAFKQVCLTIKQQS